MSHKSLIGSRIAQARKDQGLTLKELSERVETLSAGRIGNWEHGSRSPGPQEAQELAKALKVAPSYLLGLTDNPRGEVTLLHELLPKCVPVINFTDAKELNTLLESRLDNTTPFSTANDKIFLEGKSSKKAGPKTFATEINDDSMAPDFYPGDVIIVDPEQEPKPGQYILAVINETNKVVFRKYRELDTAHKGDFELQALNNDWRSLRITDNGAAKIIALMIEHRRYR